MGDMYGECKSCGATEQSSLLDANDICVPCNKVREADGEIPVEVVLKLLSMAETRHPRVAHEEAPQFRTVLEREGIIPSQLKRRKA